MNPDERDPDYSHKQPLKCLFIFPSTFCLVAPWMPPPPTPKPVPSPTALLFFIAPLDREPLTKSPSAVLMYVQQVACIRGNKGEDQKIACVAQATAFSSDPSSSFNCSASSLRHAEPLWTSPVIHSPPPLAPAPPPRRPPNSRPKHTSRWHESMQRRAAPPLHSIPLVPPSHVT